MNPNPIVLCTATPSLQLNRRRFLQASALAVASAPFYGALVTPGVRAQSVPASKKLRLGFIGVGGMGLGDLASFFMNPEVECPVVCDVDDKRIGDAVAYVEKQRGKKPDTTKDFRRVIERKDVDAVLIATPDHWHALPTVLACQAGKDVYVEKPLARTIDEGRAMVTAAQRHNRIVQMGTQWRSSPGYAAAVDFVRSGKLGKVSLVHVWVYLDWIGNIGTPPDGPVPAGVDYDMWLGPAPKRAFNPNRFHFNFRWFWDYAGGLMTDWGVHMLNIVFWALGQQQPKTITSTGGILAMKDNRETPDTQITVYEFPEFSLIWEHKVGFGVGLNKRPTGISFTGTEGTLITDGATEIIREPKKDTIEPAKFPGSGDARPAHVRNFLDCVKSRQQPATNLEVGHFVTSIAHLGNIAYRTGEKIAWDPIHERIPGSRKADALVGTEYRKPWELPYTRRG